MNDDLGYSGTTFYYYSEGKINLDRTVELVNKRLNQTKIKKAIVFTADGIGAQKLKQIIKRKNVEIIAVTFPYRQPFHTNDNLGNRKEFFAGTSKKTVCNELRQSGITLVQGVMPLQDIPIPNGLHSDTKIQTINSTLSLFSGGLKLCIEAILMASDAGYIEQGEETIAFSADTAIIATGCRKEWLFHPIEGLEIKEFICKPRKLSITHKPIEKKDE
jgi:hypothetical protein